MLEFAITAFLTLFVIVDPPGLAPLFMAVAGDRPPAVQKHLAGKATLVAGLVLAVFAFGGQPLLGYLGVSIDSLRVAGGILLFMIAVEMVLARRFRQTPEELEESHQRADVSVFPLAIPLMAGPGAFASVLVLVAEARGRPAFIGLVYGAGLLVFALAYVSFRLAGRLTAVLGHTGVQVVTRVLGIILAALAVQFVADGALGLLRSA